jgi:hypothetical protein
MLSPVHPKLLKTNFAASRSRNLSGDQTSIDNDVRFKVPSKPVGCTFGSEGVGKQERHGVGQTDGDFFIVGERRNATACQQRLVGGKGDVHETGWAVADRSNDSAVGVDRRRRNRECGIV